MIVFVAHVLAFGWLVMLVIQSGSGLKFDSDSSARDPRSATSIFADAPGIWPLQARRGDI